MFDEIFANDQVGMEDLELEERMKALMDQMEAEREEIVIDEFESTLNTIAEHGFGCFWARVLVSQAFFFFCDAALFLFCFGFACFVLGLWGCGSLSPLP
ncbi:hypothetical protein QYF36_023237 [Acer negundo]|nr:hypothetical protein QYF36_023237 [Acer negundo]